MMPVSCKAQTDIAWKPDHSVLTIGDKQGHIYFIDPTDFQVVYTLLAYNKLVQSIAWHPISTSVDKGNHYFIHKNQLFKIFNLFLSVLFKAYLHITHI